MRNVFVRGLWGDETTQRRPKRHGHSLADEIKETRDWQYRESPLLVCSFGRPNHDTLAELGIPSTMLFSDGVINYSGAASRDSTGRRGWVNYGSDISRQKFECIAAALESNDAALWIDWDVRLVEPLPEDFWGRMNSGPPMQAPLGFGYKNKQCLWRKIQPRILHHTWFLYVRGMAIARRLLAVAAEYPLEYDERIAARVFDELSGGWKGTETYIREGYQPYCAEHITGDMFGYKAEQLVFQCQGK